MLVTVLFFHFFKINTAFMYSARSSGLESAYFNPVFSKTFRQNSRRQSSVRTAFIGLLTNVDLPFKICTCCYNHRFYLVFSAKLCPYTADTFIFCQYFSHFTLFNKKVFLSLAYFFHVLMISHSIRLNSKTMHRRTFSFIKHTALNKAFICRLTHFTAQSVNFTYQMSFCGTAY